jgi:hypothetical protein
MVFLPLFSDIDNPILFIVIVDSEEEKIHCSMLIYC